MKSGDKEPRPDCRGCEWEARESALPAPPGNAEPQLGKARELPMKSHPPSWGLAFPEASPGNAEPQLGKARELRMKSHSPSWGLAFPEASPG